MGCDPDHSSGTREQFSGETGIYHGNRHIGIEKRGKIKQKPSILPEKLNCLELCEDGTDRSEKIQPNGVESSLYM